MNSHAADDASEVPPRDSADLDGDDASLDPRARRAAALLFAAIALLMGLDLFLDAVEGPFALHVVTELGVVGLALTGLLAVRAQFLRERRRSRTLRTGLLAARADAQRYRQHSQAFARGLASAIDAQLDAWAASTAEREVALLLLKGLSLKEIAAARATSERTARQQALALYKKAGVAGRAELSAFFLEDLLAPAPPASG